MCEMIILRCCPLSFAFLACIIIGSSSSAHRGVRTAVWYALVLLLCFAVCVCAFGQLVSAVLPSICFPKRHKQHEERKQAYQVHHERDQTTTGGQAEDRQTEREGR